MILVALIAALLPFPVFADENIRPAGELIAEGYLPVTQVEILGQKSPGLPTQHSLPWPVQFHSAEYSLGNSMAQFQPFNNPPYWHGGADLRTQAGEKIFSPVSGKLEAGHYGYSTNPDGSMTKHWKPWPQKGDAMYFEVAVITEDGLRYEFHHVNRASLPEEIVQSLNSENPTVTAGAHLGNVIRWRAGNYHHVHYNVILPDGTRINPEFVSTLIPDSLPPEILSVYAIQQDGKVMNLAPGSRVTGIREFVIRTQDRQNDNVYVHPPVYAGLLFENGMRFEWDFRRTLTTAAGTFPAIWDFFLSSINDPKGGRQKTEGGYGTGQSLIRLPKPEGAEGPFRIELKDIAGNTSEVQGYSF